MLSLRPVCHYSNEHADKDPQHSTPEQMVCLTLHSFRPMMEGRLIMIETQPLIIFLIVAKLRDNDPAGAIVSVCCGHNLPKKTVEAHVCHMIANILCHRYWRNRARKWQELALPQAHQIGSGFPPA